MTKSLDRSLGLEVAVDPLRAIQKWVHVHLGIFYPEHKLCMLEGRLLGLCRKAQIPTIQELHQTLVLSPKSGIALDLAHAVSTNHTAFFREVETFDYFMSSIVPNINGPFRIWSAAASTGEESYTLAMLLVQALGLSQAQERVSILGTDISAEVIGTAEAACYNQIDGIPEAYRAYLVAHRGGFAIHPGVRRLCMFRRLNLLRQPWPFKQQFQVVFSRNVLYYFDTAQQEQLLQRFYTQTKPGGWLLTSVTESLRGLNVPWKMVRPGIYRKESP